MENYNVPWDRVVSRSCNRYSTCFCAEKPPHKTCRGCTIDDSQPRTEPSGINYCAAYHCPLLTFVVHSTILKQSPRHIVGHRHSSELRTSTRIKSSSGSFPNNGFFATQEAFSEAIPQSRMTVKPLVIVSSTDLARSTAAIYSYLM